MLRCKSFTRRISLLLFLLFVQGCDLFQTRDPQSPSQISSNYKPPVTPEIVLDNLASAVAEYNAVHYIQCLADTSSSSRQFEFIPSAEVAGSFASIFQSWSPEKERRYFQNLGQPTNAAPFLSLTNKQQVAASSDSVVYNIDYTLSFPHHNTSAPQTVRGKMQLFLGANAQASWSIYRWQDFKTTQDSTWSLWKAIFSGS